MINAKKLIKLVRKWKKLAALSRKRITLPATIGKVVDEDCCSTSSTVEKGHLVVHSIDRKRFVLPLEYFSNKIARKLFKLEEDEIGLPGNRPLTLRCDSVSVKYIINMIQRHETKDIEKALFMSMASSYKTLFKIFIFILKLF